MSLRRSSLILRNLFKTLFNNLNLFIINFGNQMNIFKCLINLISNFFIKMVIICQFFSLNKFIIFRHSMMSFGFISLWTIKGSLSLTFFHIVKNFLKIFFIMNRNLTFFLMNIKSAFIISLKSQNFSDRFSFFIFSNNLFDDLIEWFIP